MRDRIIETLKDIGLKVTPQRSSHPQACQRKHGASVCREYLPLVLKEYPGISFATVYNTRSKLAEAGKVQELDIDPHKKRFDPSTAHHCHFYCRECGNVFDVACETYLPESVADTKTVDGHEVDVIQLNFKGVCRNCARKQHGDDAGTIRKRRER